ncbi:MAG: DUF2953 domain-containing protein [Butyrivibrio sp.]|nr:DUF2953 domain-containing protein [Butyrivibrio sp.]
MLAGVLTVLKIIGITLLIILAALLVILLLVLFVPVFYRLDAHVPETDLDEGFDVQKVDAAVKFSWLLFVIRGGISFPKEKEFTVRVFGFKVLPKKEKPEKEDGKEEKEKEKETDKEEAPKEESDSSKADENKSDTESSGQNTSPDDAKSEEDKTEDTNLADDSKEQKDFIDVLCDIIEGVSNILKIPLNVFEKIAYTISRVCDKIDMIKSTLENEIFQRAFALVKRKLIRLIKMILPDKCRIDAMFGLGDPALTAEVYAAYAAVRPFFPKKLRMQLEPDFDRKVVYTDTHMKGHITIFTALYIAATCYFNKDVKKTIRRFKKIINS